MFFALLNYFPNRKYLFDIQKSKKNYPLSIIIPCYNEEKVIEKTVMSVLKSDYPNLKKVIVVDDCSTDNSFKIIKQMARKYSKVLAVQTPKNTGKAAGSKNYGTKFATTELIGYVDSDSFVEKSAIRKMIGFFDDPKIGAVTSVILVDRRNNFLEKMQAIEYKLIAFRRKLLEFIDSIYVTPGPLAIYRRKAFDDVKGFDESNLTEDIEITWNMISKGYVIRMSMQSYVYTIPPNKLKPWIKQRIRWNIGGFQTMLKYRHIFFRKGILGIFIGPFFLLQGLLGVAGLSIFLFRIIRTLTIKYHSFTSSTDVGMALSSFGELSLLPNVLIFFGLLVLLLSFYLTFLTITRVKEKRFKRHGIFNILLQMFIYLLAYSILYVVSLYKFARGGYKW
jgi:cellulose synthase/poly-beta-1,6-N-acetylglucosamine synthase-like glycosyltransferase